MKDRFKKILNIKSKKTVITLLILSFAFISGTLAYYTNNFSLSNPFSTSTFASSVNDAFISPNGWEPGDTTSKTLTVTNDGDVSMMARVRMIEQWKDSNNNVISNTISSGESAAIVNFHNTDKWVSKTCDGVVYFMYTDVLDEDDVSETLIDSVTFNPNVSGRYSCTSVSDGQGGNIVQCDNSVEQYEGGTYSLSFDVETVQSTGASTAWGTCTANTYTVSFDANGGTGSMSDISCTSGQNCTLTANSFTAPHGYVFGGWARTTSTDIMYDDEEVVKNMTTTGTVTLYAIWEPPTNVNATDVGYDNTNSGLNCSDPQCAVDAIFALINA